MPEFLLFIRCLEEFFCWFGAFFSHEFHGIGEGMAGPERAGNHVEDLGELLGKPVESVVFHGTKREIAGKDYTHCGQDRDRGMPRHGVDGCRYSNRRDRSEG